MSSEQGSAPQVVVVGGANTDIVGRSFAPLIERDSNPGYVHMSAGGVGRNIAENLARLGVRTDLVTALGGDSNAEQLAARCRAAGIGIDSVLIAPDLPGSLYIALHEDDGMLALAMSDMRPLDRLTPVALEERRNLLDAADLVVADTNVDALALAWLAAHVRAPLVLDLVSVPKAPRARDIIGRLAALRCNVLEAAVLLGIAEPQSDSQIEYVAERLLALGVGAVFLTLGLRGVHYASADARGWMTAPRVGVARATGAGDAFSAGVAAGMLEALDVRGCAEFGSVLAGIALASEHTVSDRVSRDAVSEAIRGDGS